MCGGTQTSGGGRVADASITNVERESGSPVGYVSRGRTSRYIYFFSQTPYQLVSARISSLSLFTHTIGVFGHSAGTVLVRADTYQETADTGSVP